MVETRDWVKLGQTTWRVHVVLDDGEEPWAETVASAEFPSRAVGLACAYANRNLRGRTNPEPAYEGADRGYYWARVERGTYVDDSFDAAGDGYVRDAKWEPDLDEAKEPVARYAHLSDAGEIIWGTA